MTSHFLAIRVRPADRRPTERLAPDSSLLAVWLLAEWPPQVAQATAYWLSDLPKDTDRLELVRLTKIRWRTENDYRELKTPWGRTTSRAVPSPAGTATSPWSAPLNCFITQLRTSPASAFSA